MHLQAVAICADAAWGAPETLPPFQCAGTELLDLRQLLPGLKVIGLRCWGPVRDDHQSNERTASERHPPAGAHGAGPTRQFGIVAIAAAMALALLTVASSTYC